MTVSAFLRLALFLLLIAGQAGCVLDWDRDERSESEDSGVLLPDAGSASHDGGDHTMIEQPDASGDAAALPVTGPSCGSLQCAVEADCLSDQAEPRCMCSQGFLGDGTTCQDHDECSVEGATPCDANATCSNEPGSFSCTCKPGYQPDSEGHCVDIDECTTQANGGCPEQATCNNTPGGRSCSCNPGYQDIHGDGSECVDKCNLAGCDEHAACTLVAGEAKCDCTSPYIGDGKSCAFDSECSELHCDPNARCVVSGLARSCECRGGYRGNGQACTNIDECSEQTDDCHANANCTDNQGSFQCACKPGYQGTGKVCTNIDDCASVPCLHSGSCQDLVGGYTCNCASTGYEGTQCQTNTNDCTPGACLNGGICTDLVKDVSCACQPGYSGKLCATDACSPNPCQHGGACSRTAMGALCTCGAAFDGALCQNDVNECTTGKHNCDANANCTNTTGSFSCQCKAPYVGSGTSCACPTGYTGSSCTQCAAGYVSGGGGTCVLERTISIVFAGDSTGTVSLGNGLPDCSVSCVRKVAQGTALKLTASVAPYTKVAGWSLAACSGGSCTFTVTGDASVTVTFNLAHNIAFVTSSKSILGGIGGLTQADAECARLASLSGLHPKTWVAYLSTEGPCPGKSTGSCHPTDRLAGSRGWVNVKGEPIADTVADLKGDEWLTPVRYTNGKGDTYGAAPVLTGSKDGAVLPGETCLDYTSTSAPAPAWGSASAVGQNAEYVFESFSCGAALPYYCFSSGENAPLPARVASGRLAFITANPWTPGGGLSAADSACQKEACAAGLTGSSNCATSTGTSRIFKAWLATPSGSGATRFSTSGADYYRTDGVLWLRAADLVPDQSGDFMTKTGLNIGADGQRVVDYFVWTGTTTNHCANWTDHDQAMGDHGHSEYFGRLAIDGGESYCYQGPFRLYCLQQ